MNQKIVQHVSVIQTSSAKKIKISIFRKFVRWLSGKSSEPQSHWLKVIIKIEVKLKIIIKLKIEALVVILSYLLLKFTTAEDLWRKVFEI